jgi:predicted amidophosphoribosyltransferase
MALINCHECKKEISDSASSCPGCGAPIKSAQPKKGDVIPYTNKSLKRTAQTGAASQYCAGSVRCALRAPLCPLALRYLR